MATCADSMKSLVPQETIARTKPGMAEKEARGVRKSSKRAGVPQYAAITQSGLYPRG